MSSALHRIDQHDPIGAFHQIEQREPDSFCFQYLDRQGQPFSQTANRQESHRIVSPEQIADSDDAKWSHGLSGLFRLSGLSGLFG
jgi:hypothetical protein